MNDVGKGARMLKLFFFCFSRPEEEMSSPAVEARLGWEFQGEADCHAYHGGNVSWPGIKTLFFEEKKLDTF